MQALREVLENYLLTKKDLGGRTKRDVNTVDNLALRVTLPSFFKSILSHSGRLDDFVVTSSFGKGNIADVPWVGVFNRRVTASAQTGYYIVLLFAKDMKSCVLSLNQGVDALRKLHSESEARRVLEHTGRIAQRYIRPHVGARLGPIPLGGKTSLGRGYEKGAIESFIYEVNSLPSTDELKENFLSLLKNYDDLYRLIGKSLQVLHPTSENRYQQAALETENEENDGFREPKGPTWRPPKRPGTTLTGYQRNPKIAGQALAKAQYKCEFDSAHATFISSAQGRPYVEAHHLIPMSQQDDFEYSLDVTFNITALCPSCHKLLHHGRFLDKKPILEKLFKSRQLMLNEVGICLDLTDLFGMYNRDLLEDEG